MGNVKATRIIKEENIHTGRKATFAKIGTIGRICDRLEDEGVVKLLVAFKGAPHAVECWLGDDVIEC